MISKQSNWRLIHTKPAPGGWNMAVDEAILESVTAGDAPPTFRLYAWEPACLSLGYGQRYGDVDERLLQERGWDLVRRPTGGRAILHVDELTYSICATSEHPLMKNGILLSYKEISQALLRGLDLLAVPAMHEEKYDLPADANPKGPVCFEIPANWEITFEGKKLIGSAQVRRSGGVLQHGTLPLDGDLTRITQALSFEGEEARAAAANRLLERATTVQTAIGRIVTWAEAAAAIEQGVSDGLGVTFTRGDLLPAEVLRVKTLMEEKYSNATWTKKR